MMPHLCLAFIEEAQNFRVVFNGVVESKVMSIHDRINHSLTFVKLLLKLQARRIHFRKLLVSAVLS
jgi:hypothetical protein